MSDGPSHAARFDENEYARPNQPWLCGWASEGHACPLGPTKWGICRSAHECSPYQNGDTWVCARTKTQGGTCDEGPLPDGTCCHQIQKCQPTRSILSRRGVVSFTVFAAAVALALIILGSPTREKLVSPGELTAQHSQVIDRCEDCHAAAKGGVADWIRASRDGKAARRQSDQCLKCHADLGPDAKNPHSRPPEELATSTLVNLLSIERGGKLSDESGADEPLDKVQHANRKDIHGSEQLACATCHREHGGSTVDLTELTNAQCQSCHVNSFSGFGDGHPELTAYPYKRRTRLYFDHLSHYGNHFSDGTRGNDRSCSDCHQADSAGRFMLVKQFELTCAECHAHQIQDGTAPGLAAISLPAFDVDALVKNGRSIGEWPREYPLHVEAGSEISPLQRLLLQSYAGFAELEGMLADVDLRDLRDADTEQLAAVETLVWMLKESLYDIVRNGHPEIRRRLTALLGGDADETEIATLANSYPVLLAIQLQRKFLPTLLTEVEARRVGSDLPAPSEVPAPDTAALITAERQESEMLASGWRLHASSLSLRYRPIGHADPLLKTLLDIGSGGARVDSESTPVRATLHDLLDQVASPFAAGRCTKCHSIDQTGEESARVNWQSYQPPIDQHKFTHFSHAPHVTLLSAYACSKCHSMTESDATAELLFRPQFIDRHWRTAMDPHAFESDFVPMSQFNCAECHNNNTGRDGCLSCHNYHVR